MNKRYFRLVFAAVVLLASTLHAQDKGYDVHFYNADLVISVARDSISGNVTMYARATSPLSQILQHAKGLTIDRILVDGVEASWTVSDTATGSYFINNFTALSTKSLFTVKTYYHGVCTNEGGSSPWGGVTNNGKMMFAMGVGFHAPYISCTRHWLPCYDLPDDKVDSVWMRFYTPETPARYTISNGLSIPVFMNDTMTGSLTEWHVSHPIATYLLTFAVGPFKKVQTPNSLGIPFDSYAYLEDTAKVSLLMRTKIADALVFFDSLFGKYPFEKVGYVVAPIGSMEHQTMITLDYRALDTAYTMTVAAHELSHMWWGDRVTCKDFNDPWLNEGFATFCESLILERFKSKAAYWVRQKSNIANAISGGSTIPMYGTPLTTHTSSNYPPDIIYKKGASVLGMLRYFIGDEKFFTAVRAYGNAHAYANATSFDLQNDFEKSTGGDLGWFFKKWVFGIGYPQLGVTWSRNSGAVKVTFEQKQDSIKQGFFRLPLVIEARKNSGEKERHTVWLDSTHFSSASFDASFTPDTIVIDPDGAVIKKIIGPVKLGVKIEDIGNVTGLETYSMSFSPNPTNSSFITLTLDHASARTKVRATMAELNTGEHELAIYDSGGEKLITQALENPAVTNRDGDNRYSYNVDIHSLPSGTYFAFIMFGSNQIVGHGQFVVVK